MTSPQQQPPPELNDNAGTRVLIALAWPVATLLAIVILGSTAIVVGIVESPSETIHSIAQIFAQGQQFSRIVALLIIVPAIFGLTITDKVSGAAAIAALSAIAGYVLGGIAGKGP